MIDSSIFSLILFAIFMTASPGPGNLLMMACGVSLDYKKSIFFLAGLVTGKTLVNVLIFFGLGVFVIDNDIFYDLLKYLSSAFILFFAISSLRTKNLNNLNSKFSFKNGFIIHPLSPKTWSMLILAQSQLLNLGLSQIQRSFIVWIIFTVGQILFHTSWCLSGAMLGKVVTNNIILSRVIFIITIIFVFWFLVLG